nr:MAG TPA_asm: hypothetical protein [Caudoviricetes sp.]
MLIRTEKELPACWRLLRWSILIGLSVAVTTGCAALVVWFLWVLTTYWPF